MKPAEIKKIIQKLKQDFKKADRFFHLAGIKKTPRFSPPFLKTKGKNLKREET